MAVSVSTASWSRPSTAAARFEQARSFAGFDDHAGRMAGAGEFQHASAEIEAGGDQREVKHRAAQTANHETIEMLHHGMERDAAFDLRHRFGVNAIGHQGRADAVAGDVANHQTEMIGARRDEPEISSDGAHRLVKSFDGDSSPDQISGRETLLHARRQQQILFDFAMALLELNVGFAQTQFGALLRGYVGEGDDGEDRAVGIFQLLRGDHDGQAAAVSFREEKFEEVAALPLASLDLLD